MPQNVTDASTFDDPIVEMADSDPLDATYARTAIQGLANRTRYLDNEKPSRFSVGYLFKGGQRPYLRSVSTTQIEIGPIPGVMIAGVAHDAGSIATTITPALTANAWYYVYTYDDAGVIAFEVVMVAPDPTLTYKSTDATRRYIGCFRTDASSHVVPFRMDGGNYLYRWSGQSVSDFWRALNGGAATTATAIPLNDAGGGNTLAPPHVRQVTVRVRTSNFHTSDTGVNVFTYGDTGVGYDTDAPASGYSVDVFNIECDSSQRLGYVSGNAACTLTLWVMGFRE